MTITGDWVMGLVGVLAAGGIVGLIKHIVSDAGTLQRINDLDKHFDQRVTAVESKLDTGILPRTDERLKSLERQLEVVRVEALRTQVRDERQ